MPFLKIFREGNLLPFITDKDRPPSIQAKLVLIEGIFDRALLYQLAKTRTRAGVPNFYEHLKNLMLNLKQSTKHMTIRPITPEQIQEYRNIHHLDNIHTQETDSLCIAIRQMAHPEFEPETNLITLAKMLILLWLFWSLYPYSRGVFGADDPESNLSLAGVLDGVPPPAPSFERHLDHSLTKIALQVGIETANLRHWGEEKEGIARRNLKRKAESTEREVRIANAFHDVSKKKGDFRNSIVERIYKHLNETVGKKTIERWIGGNAPLMKKYFQKEQRGKGHRWVYIRHTGV